MIASWLLLGAPSRAADCEERHFAAEVASVLESAERAWASADHFGFDAVADRAVAMVDCLAEPASPQLVASLHRVRGIRLHQGGSDDEAVRFLAAAIAIDP